MIDADTATPLWDGEPFDLSLAVDWFIATTTRDMPKRTTACATAADPLPPETEASNRSQGATEPLPRIRPTFDTFSVDN